VRDDGALSSLRSLEYHEIEATISRNAGGLRGRAQGAPWQCRLYFSDLGAAKRPGSMARWPRAQTGSGYARLKGTSTRVVAFFRKAFGIAHHLHDIQ
jgi:hypothetical protein